MSRLAALRECLRATEIDVVALADLTAEAFRHEFVLQHRPCIIRGPAPGGYAGWTPASLIAKLGADFVLGGGYDHSGILFAPFAESDVRARVKSWGRSMSLAGFFERLRQSRSLYLAAYAVSLASDRPGAVLRSDLPALRFIDLKAQSPRLYHWRLFLYQNSYTDWHFHSVDETLTLQAVGSKRVALLPPTRAVWKSFFPLFERGGLLNGSQPNLLRDLPISTGVLNAGDLIYIPQYWWHAFESACEGWGATVSITFRTPLRHMTNLLRYPGARRSLRAIYAWPRIKYAFGKPPRNKWFADLLYSRWVLLQMLVGSLVPVAAAGYLWPSRARQRPPVRGDGGAH
jgi:Cupin-like domain